MSVTVVVPWRGGCAHRERILAWILDRWAEHHPSWKVELAPAPDGRWCKAAAVMPAIERADEVVVMADADVWPRGLESAMRAVTCGAAAWAIPHRRVFRLTEASTRIFMEGAALAGLDLAQGPYWGTKGGGVVVAERATLLDCPLDPRFVGWGQEDHAWGIALWALHGPAWRGEAPLAHLWHPPQERETRKTGSAASKRLLRRYSSLRDNPVAMRALIEEFRDRSPTDDPPAHPDPAHAGR